MRTDPSINTERPGARAHGRRPEVGRGLSGGGLIIAVVIAASLLLAWHAAQRHADAERQRAILVDASSRAAAREITLELEDLRRSVQRLVETEQDRIQYLAQNPQDHEALQALTAMVQRNFPDAFAITLADGQGRELIDNFDGEILDVCRSDIAQFAQSGKPTAALVHPNPLGYHFDVTVPADFGAQQGVFFVSFHPHSIAQVLRTNQLDGYDSYLLKAGDERGLIELSTEGARNRLQRSFFLDQEERRRIAARVPVVGTQWDLVLVQPAGIDGPWVSKPLRDAGIAILLLWSIGGLAAWWVRGAQRAVRYRDRQLREQAEDLEHSEQRLRLLHRTTSASGLGRAAKIDAVLKMGLQEFGLDLGIVSRICGERYEVLYTLSADQRLKPGTTFPLGDTYCRHMLSTGDAVGIAHVAQSHWKAHPCYRAFGLESYIGAPIVIDGTVSGTLNFSSTSPRARPFTERDLDLLRIMARWVGMEIEREQAEQRLRQSENYLQSILDTVTDAILTVDGEGRVTTWNQAALDLFAYSSAQLEGRAVQTLVPGLPQFEPDDAESTAGDEERSPVLYAQGGNGARFPVEVSIQRMRGTETARFTAVIRDVSERHSTEQALRVNHRLLQAVSDVQSRFIAEVGDTAVFEALLGELLTLTDSASGCIAEVCHGEDGGAQLEVYAARGEHPLDEFCQRVLRSPSPVSEQTDAGARLGLPIHHGAQLLGLVALAQRPDGYDVELARLIEPLLATCANLMQASRSDRQLRQTTQLQAAILRTTRYMVIVTDPDGTIVTFNEAAEQALGYHAEELVGRHSPAMFHDAAEIAERAVSLSAELGYDMAPGFEVFVHKARRGEVEERIWHFVRKNGTRFPALLSVNALTDYTGAVTGFLGIAKDMTDQLAAEEAVRRSQEQLAEAEERSRLLLESAGDGIYGLDDSGRTVFVNPAAARMLGYEVDELIGTPMHNLVHHSHADGSPYPREECPMYAAFCDGHVRRITDEVLWRKDGSAFPVEYTSTPIRKDGELVGAVVIFKDVTEARAAERALRQSEARLAEAQRVAHIGSWEWNVRTNETYWSDETFRIFGYVPRHFEPDFSRFTHHIHSEDRQRVLDELANAAAAGTQFQCSYRIITTSGLERDVHDRGQCIIDAHGNTERMVGIVQDVTEQRKIDRMKNEFVSTVSHELRTPLTSIRGSLGLLSGFMTDGLPAQAKDLIAIAQRNSERLLLLINDILDLSKIESGRLAFHMRDLEVTAFLRQAIAANQGYLEQNGVQSVLVEPSLPLWIHGDPDRLMQVMNNLLSNAAKFSPPDEPVEIRAWAVDGRIRVEVRDRGPGIPEDFQDQVFDRFTQADASDTRKLGGTGLGLSIAKAIVERHGGRIGFDTHADQGTTFHFDLPVAAPLVAPLPARGGRNQTARNVVLVCEDDHDTAHLIGLLLQENDYDAELTYSAAEARALLEQRRYCAMTLDLRLPDGNGLQLLQEIRRNDSTRGMPVIIVSAVADERKQDVNGSAIGVLDWLDKPIDHGRLRAALARLEIPAASSRPRVLHVEDDNDICEIVRLLLQSHADVQQAASVADARRALRHGRFDLVLLDLELTDGCGLELLDDLADHAPSAPAVVFSASELDEAHREHVHSAFVKARTSDLELRDRLLAALEECGAPGRQATADVGDA